MRPSGNQYLSSLSGLQVIISDNVEDQYVSFRTCLDVVHFKRFVANVTISSIGRNKSLVFYLSPGGKEPYRTLCNVTGTHDLSITASDIDTSKKWCMGFRPSGTSVISFSINSIYAYAS